MGRFITVIGFVDGEDMAPPVLISINLDHIVMVEESEGVNELLWIHLSDNVSSGTGQLLSIDEKESIEIIRKAITERSCNTVSDNMRNTLIRQQKEWHESDKKK